MFPLFDIGFSTDNEELFQYSFNYIEQYDFHEIRLRSGHERYDCNIEVLKYYTVLNTIIILILNWFKRRRQETVFPEYIGRYQYFSNCT